MICIYNHVVNGLMNLTDLFSLFFVDWRSEGGDVVIERLTGLSVSLIGSLLEPQSCVADASLAQFIRRSRNGYYYPTTLISRKI